MRHSRQDDETVLLALCMREDGCTYKEIGKAIGKNPNQVIGMIDRVYRAEKAMSPGESNAGVKVKVKVGITLPDVGTLE